MSMKKIVYYLKKIRDGIISFFVELFFAIVTWFW